MGRIKNIKSQVETIRKNVATALQQVINFIFSLNNIDLGLNIVFGDIFQQSAQEKANLTVTELNNNLGLKKDILQAYTGYDDKKMNELMQEIEKKESMQNNVNLNQ